MSLNPHLKGDPVEKCWAESYCKSFNEERTKCHELCIGYLQLKTIFRLSRVPKRYQYQQDIPLTVESEEERNSFIDLKIWQDSVVDNVKNGRGLFLVSSGKGNGKTTWACKIMNSYFRHVALSNDLKCRGIYINVPDFFNLLRRDMDNPSEEVEDLIEDIKRADIVIWDDIGAESPTKWVREQLYIYIGYRYGEMKSQIFTSNVSIEELEKEELLGERVVSRILGSSETINFYGRDRRTNR